MGNLIGGKQVTGLACCGSDHVREAPQAARNFTLSAGYRYLWLDRQAKGASFQGSMSGPLAGAPLAF
ncbi:hypothetical protein [Erythrobacter tepidarius]|uniref:hypothetical protein n=1 Tax=Erythrobacter tepidarius TaxID=60454 RepID=UPI0011807ED5|nr:hypothetical protein [Erythrobacter tepidarius]